MRSNVWCAWYRDIFNPDQYIYHYTSFETALRILYDDQLRLSPLSKTNDTTEQKVRIQYDFPIAGKKNDIKVFEDYWSMWSKNSKVICFSRDRAKSEKTSLFTDPFDVTGRGFALPRMWAQYARNNCGVCFILFKNAFVKKVQETYPEAIGENVSYFDWSDSFRITEDLFDKLLNIIKHNRTSTYAPTLLKENPQFAQYSYFSKLKDWESENEYRILVPNIDSTYLYVDGIRSCLAGLVLGESMEPSFIQAMKNALPPKIPVRRIVFEMSRCKIEELTD